MPPELWAAAVALLVLIGGAFFLRSKRKPTVIPADPPREDTAHIEREIGAADAGAAALDDDLDSPDITLAEAAEDRAKSWRR